MDWSNEFDATTTWDTAAAADDVNDDEDEHDGRNETTPIACSNLSQSNCLMPVTAKRLEMSVPIYGYISPPVILLTIITNSLICVVLLRRGMRTATNLLLAAMALSDMLTGLCPLPCFVYFYTFRANRDWVPYSWCAAYVFLTDRLPTVVHTASIWLTMALAIHRYICVCKPQTAKTWCTVNVVLRTIVCIYVAACISQITRFFDTIYKPEQLRSLVNPEAWVEGCVYFERPFIADHIELYYNAYYSFRVIFIHLVPCCLLVILNALLVLTIRQAQRRRRQLLAQNRKSESCRLAESNVTTMMLVAVVGVFLLVEFPLAILVIVLMVDNTFVLDLLDARRRDIYEQLINLFILLSYPINFFIYCGMSQQFRDTFCGLFASARCCAGGQAFEAAAGVEEISLHPTKATAVKARQHNGQQTYIELVQDDVGDKPGALDAEPVANDAV